VCEYRNQDVKFRVDECFGRLMLVKCPFWRHYHFFLFPRPVWGISSNGIHNYIVTMYTAVPLLRPFDNMLDRYAN